MRIAVTGGSGFIGKHVIAEARRRGHHVRGFAGPHRTSANAGDAAVEVLSLDLRVADGLAAALRDIEVVVHCAAALSGDLATQAALTVGGTRNLLAAMKEAGVRDIVLIGSFAVYDYQSIDTNTQLDESSPLEPKAGARAPYIQVKQQQEELVRNAEGMAWTIVRPGIVFGPGRTWFHQLGAQLPGGLWLCLAPEAKFPITHVDNCAEAIVLAAENRGARGTIITLVDDDLPRRGEYIAELLRNEPTKPRTLNLSWRTLASMARLASVAGERAPDLLKPGSLSARCKPLQYSNTRAKTVLGWSPRLDWRTGIASAVKVHA